MNRKGLNIMRYFLWFLLLGAGFFAGVSWKSNDTQPKNDSFKEISEEGTTKALRVNEPPTNDGDLMDSEKATIKLFEEAAPSVCFITTSNVRRDYWSRDLSEIPRGTGSGFVWDKKGHIVTNYHVIQGADRAQVTLSDGSSWQASLVGTAPEKDLAVLKIEASGSKLRPIPIGQSERLRVGQSVYAIGNPFGLDQTLTTGIVSALGREIQSGAGIPIRDVIQSDAAINPGNSGGPLLDSSGKLIGVNTAIYSPSGASAGIGFSIPESAVSWIVPDLIKYGELRRPTLGISLARSQLTDRLGVEGVLVIEVIKGSAAERSGINPTYQDRNGKIHLGDVIVGIDEKKISNNGDLLLALEKYKPGDQVTIKLLRDEETLKLPLKLDQAR